MYRSEEPPWNTIEEDSGENATASAKELSTDTDIEPLFAETNRVFATKELAKLVLPPWSSFKMHMKLVWYFLKIL